MFNFVKTKKFNLLQKPLTLFDVSLRDGLQSYPKVLNINEKKKLLDKIIDHGNVENIEVGSIVSQKHIPQMKNSIDLYHYAKTINNNFNYYMLVPSIKACKLAIENNIENVSFITSVSNEFQKKNINQSLIKTYKNLKIMNDMVIKSIPNPQIKIYVSCINQCPITGMIDNNFIVDQLDYINKNYKFKYLCLSDTCGNLDFDDFKYIIDNIRDKIDFSKISLHLHEQKNNKNIQNIIQYGYENNIFHYDISSYENLGGCGMTIENPHSNITSERLYKSLLL